MKRELLLRVSIARSTSERRPSDDRQEAGLRRDRMVAREEETGLLFPHYTYLHGQRHKIQLRDRLQDRIEHGGKSDAYAWENSRRHSSPL